MSTLQSQFVNRKNAYWAKMMSYTIQISTAENVYSCIMMYMYVLAVLITCVKHTLIWSEMKLMMITFQLLDKGLQCVSFVYFFIIVFGHIYLVYHIHLYSMTVA